MARGASRSAIARRKPARKAEPPSEPQLPMFEGPAREPELHVFPHTLRTGDRLDGTI